MSAKPIIGLSLATTKLHNLYVLSAITPAKADFTLASLRNMGMESQNVSRVGTVRPLKLFLVDFELSSFKNVILLYLFHFCIKSNV